MNHAVLPTLRVSVLAERKWKSTSYSAACWPWKFCSKIRDNRFYFKVSFNPLISTSSDEHNFGLLSGRRDGRRSLRLWWLGRSRINAYFLILLLTTIKHRKMCTIRLELISAALIEEALRDTYDTSSVSPLISRNSLFIFSFHCLLFFFFFPRIKMRDIKHTPERRKRSPFHSILGVEGKVVTLYTPAPLFVCKQVEEECERE